MTDSALRNLKRRSLGEKIVIWIFFAIFLIYAFSLIFPFLWCIVNSFKTTGEFLSLKSMWGLPKNPTLKNWIESFSMTAKGLTILEMYGNSIIFTLVNTFLHIMSCSAAAYIMSKYDFKFRSVVFSFLLVIMMVPTMGSMSSVYKIYNDVHLINTYVGIFIQNCGGFGTFFLLLYGFYKNLSWTYAEAAQIDGASHSQIYFKIMLPMAIPALTAVGILVGIGQWNDYFTIYMYAPEKATIAVGLEMIANDVSSTSNYPLVFASMMFSIIPILVIFIVFQKTIMNNTAVGGIKG